MDFENFNSFLDENPEFKEKYERLTDEEKQQFHKAVATVEKIVFNLWEFTKQAYKVCGIIIERYPNKRAVHLAKYSKKERTRKKNIHRIIKDVQKRGRKWTTNS